MQAPLSQEKEMTVWYEVVLGITFVAGTMWLIKTVYGWRRFRKSIQAELYSGFLEYCVRKRKIRSLSESYYLNSEFGKHRIIYQLTQSKHEKTPQSYVLIILTSGLYILNVRNQSGKILARKNGDFKQNYDGHEYLFKNPVKESRYFEKRLREKMAKMDFPVRLLVVFPESCELQCEGEEIREVPVIHRKQLIQWMKKDYEDNHGILQEEQIDRLFETIAEESIEAEKMV